MRPEPLPAVFLSALPWRLTPGGTGALQSEAEEGDAAGPSGAGGGTERWGSSLLRRGKARVDRQKLIIILVGLPGRGKTFLCNKLMCYLNW
jgi:6-phosphofructo-2-kinase